MSSAPDPRARTLEQQVWSIIRASGGWNARARARLSLYASTHRIAPTRIAAAVRSVAGQVPGGGQAQAAGHVQAAAQLHAAAQLPAAAEAPLRAKAGPTVAATSAATPSRSMLLPALLLVAGVLLSGALVWVAADQVQRAQHAADQAAEAANIPTPDSPEAPATPDRSKTHAAAAPDTAHAVVTTPRAVVPGRSVPAAMAVFPHPPVLLGDLSTAWLREALETLSAQEVELEKTAALTSTYTDAERAGFTRALEAYLECWPVLEPARRHAVLDALLVGVRRLDADSRQSMIDTLVSLRATTENTARAWWRASAAAGLLGALEGSGAHNLRDDYALAALEWLHDRSKVVATSSTNSAPALVADLWEAWISAADAAAATALEADAQLARDAAVLAGIDTLLRSGAALDRPGTPADAMGSFLDAIPWLTTQMRRDRIIQAWKGWLEDSSIPALSLHGATSILGARRPGSWWDPWLVIDARGSIGERQAAAQRLATALAAGGSVPDAPAPTLRGVDPELLRKWRVAKQSLSARAEPADMPGKVARAAEWMALVEAARLLERGRASDADARLEQLNNPLGLMPDESDKWRDRKNPGEARVPQVDGKLEGELRNRRSLEDRLGVLRALRTRPIHDLGPIDAETLAREALTAPSEQIRSVAQGVVSDTFENGPHVIAAVLGEVNSATSGAEAAQLAASVCGAAAPRGNDAAMRAGAALMLADRLAAIVPSDRHRLDAAARELALGASSAARVLGGDAVAGMQPESAMHAWARARADEAQHTVPGNVLVPILTHANARTRAAVGSPQRYVAEQTLLLEIDTAMLSERFPRRRSEIQGIAQRAGASRAQANDVIAQMDANARGLAELAAIAIGADAPGGQQ